jgi:hypothetical protein
MSNRGSRRKRSIEIPADRHSTGKNGDEAFMQSVSETGYWLPVYQGWLSVVKFFFFSASCFSMPVVSAPKS